MTDNDHFNAWEQELKAHVSDEYPPGTRVPVECYVSIVAYELVRQQNGDWDLKTFIEYTPGAKKAVLSMLRDALEAIEQEDE